MLPQMALIHSFYGWVIFYHFMANRWGNSGKSGWLYFPGLQNHCSHEIKRRLLLERKVMTNLDSIFKSRDITLPTKVHLVKAMVFQWSCMDVRVRLWRKRNSKELMLLNCGVVLRVPWTARRSNQSILKEISPGISLEAMMLKLKL